MTSKIIVNYCINCNKHTKHDVLLEHHESYRDEYSYDETHQIVQCRGCGTNSFRKIYFDIEAAYPDEGFGSRWIVPEDITIYPKAVEGHRKIDDLFEVPAIVRKIYIEILLALKEEAKILASLGLRAAVEAVCNDLLIKGSNLEIRINKLTTAGYISKNDAERLHGIRFMGNDAAHDIKTPKDDSLKVALQIVEHLLASVYILNKKADGTLDITTSKYVIFQNLLDSKLSQFTTKDELPIAQFLGKDLRRVKESLAHLESELITKIGNGEYKKLSVGKVDNYKNSKDKLQHFIVN